VHGYRRDLAYIHDAGFRDYALGAAPGLLQILKKNHTRRGLIVDLGCGSGRWACELNRAGYDVLGVDQSLAMIRLARKIAPRSQFKLASLWTAELPPCDAITSVGECLNYCFDPRADRCALSTLFRRVYGALKPGGIFICDFAGPDRAPRQGPRQQSSSGRNWSVMARTTVLGPRRLRRRIDAVRKIGGRRRRCAEIHELRLFAPSEISHALERSGFRARVLSSYGEFRFLPGIHGVLAKKPRN
jgi:SAM-dependent methyltransferase